MGDTAKIWCYSVLSSMAVVKEIIVQTLSGCMPNIIVPSFHCMKLENITLKFLIEQELLKFCEVCELKAREVVSKEVPPVISNY